MLSLLQVTITAGLLNFITATISGGTGFAVMLLVWRGGRWVGGIEKEVQGCAKAVDALARRVQSLENRRRPS